MNKPRIPDARWLKEFNRGFSNIEVAITLSSSKDTARRNRARLSESIEIPYVRNLGNLAKPSAAFYPYLDDIQGMISKGMTAHCVLKALTDMYGFVGNNEALNMYIKRHFMIKPAVIEARVISRVMRPSISPKDWEVYAKEDFTQDEIQEITECSGLVVSAQIANANKRIEAQS